MSVSPVQRMRICLDCVENLEKSLDDRCQAMEELIEWCENMDYAIGKFVFNSIWVV